jgi:hypothetical protein
MRRVENKGGRPLKHPGEPLSRALSFRVRPRLVELLRAAARESGRTISQETEHRVERSFADDRMNAALLGGDVGADILRTLRAAMVLEGVTPDWDGDLAKAERFRTVANAVIVAFLKLPTIDLPPPEKRLEDMQTAKELLLRYSPRHVELPAEVMFSDLEAPVLDETEEEKPPTTSKRQVGG